MDQDNITEEFERMNKELASVQASIQRLQKQNGHLNKQISEKTDDVSKQQVQIRSQQADVQKIGSSLDEMIKDNQRRAEAPDLTQEEYMSQLADRADVEKLDQLMQATYGRISMLFNQQSMMMLQQQVTNMK